MKKSKNNKTILSLLRGDFLMRNNNQKNIPFILFIVFLLLVNISISFNAVGLVRDLARLEKEVYDLRLVYITTKSDLMHYYKRSVIEEKVSSFGLKTSINPPYIIEKNSKK